MVQRSKPNLHSAVQRCIRVQINDCPRTNDCSRDIVQINDCPRGKHQFCLKPTAHNATPTLVGADVSVRLRPCGQLQFSDTRYDKNTHLNRPYDAHDEARTAVTNVHT